MEPIERFNETELPPKSAFRSILNDTEMSNEDYAHAKMYGQN